MPLSNRPNNIAVAKDGRIVVGIARGDGALDIIDPATLTLKKSIPVHGRLHNVYVTPDSKYVITGSIRESMLTVIDLATEQVAWELKLERRRAADDDRDQSGWLDQAHLRATVRPQRLRGGGFRRPARRSPASSCRSPTRFETDAGRNRRRRTASASRRTTRRCGSPAFRNNAVFVYSLDDLKLIGQVALPALKLPGHEAISAVANWVTFTPDGKTIYMSNAGSARSPRSTSPP